MTTKTNEVNVHLHSLAAKRIEVNGFDDYRFVVLHFIEDYLPYADDEQVKVLKKWERLTKRSNEDIVEFLSNSKNKRYFTDYSPMLYVLTPGERFRITERFLATGEGEE